MRGEKSEKVESLSIEQLGCDGKSDVGLFLRGWGITVLAVVGVFDIGETCALLWTLKKPAMRSRQKREEIRNAVRVRRGKGSVLCGRDALFELEEKR